MAEADNVNMYHEDALYRGNNQNTDLQADMIKFRTRYLKQDRNAFSRIVGYGRSQEVSIFVPDTWERDPSTVSGMCWTMIADRDLDQTKYQSAAFFISAIGAFIPEIMAAAVPCLLEKNVRVSHVQVPSRARQLGYPVKGFSELFSYEEALLTIGISLLLPFKQLTTNNFHEFINARKKALGGKLGLLESELTRYRYPLDLAKAKMVQSVLSSHKELKQEIIRYVMWASFEPGSLQAMASYVAQILAFNEMGMILFINNVFVNSKSPVLSHPAVQDEVDNLMKAMHHITRSDSPSFFRYFCTSEEEHLIQRQNFSVLGAVAQELMKSKSKNKSIENFAGTTEKGAVLVNTLVRIHKEYCDAKAISTRSNRLKFIFSEGNYNDLLNREAMEG